MSILVLGLLIFLGMHSLRMVAPTWRERQRARLGEKRWKALFAVVSLVGFVLLCYGFGMARRHAVLLYVPPLWLQHLNALFTLVAFVLVAAARIPRNHLKAAVGHPQVLGVKVWAFGHLLAAGGLHDVVLFGAFLLWSVALFAVSRRRDRQAGVTYPAGTLAGDLKVAVVGALAWAVFAFWLHRVLIGVDPMAGMH
ncbi:NnrU family protein [Fulvimonas yonginensis]|uniref:NnrU family protein n=1 Tax=Fulvimonas yonginensis TaxID=1495200 RepID=A0ABU8JBZ7_9GAMM